jgi:catechol 2,3-dioxygenase-like lactoylglutathione lyase family enzyme
MKAHLRVARPTADLDAVTHFYRAGLGFEVVGGFTGHDGFDGVMLGHVGAAYHLEFVRVPADEPVAPPSAEDLLVFYLPDRDRWERAVARLRGLGHESVPSANPYWDERGRTFEDPDGYRVVLENAAWSPSEERDEDTGDGSSPD